MNSAPMLMFPALLLCVLLGFPVAFCLLGVAFFFGYVAFGPAIISQMASKVQLVASNFDLVAVPLFVFMGSLLERSGIAEKLLEAMHLWTRRLPGGLALGTLVMCVIFAASTGVIGATETIVGLLAVPVMMKYRYNKAMISGVVCAGGSSGTIIPPSIVAVVLGPLADVSVGDLFLGMIFPGLLLAVSFMAYVFVRCLLDPSAGPTIAKDELEPAFAEKLAITAKAMLPASAMILCVLGSMMFGFAAPSEAAALGCLGAIALCISYSKLSWKILAEALEKTLKITSMIMFIVLAGNMFTGVFVGTGGGFAMENLLAELNFAPLTMLLVVLAIAFLAGFFLDWISVLLILVPIFMPIIAKAGYDRIWVSMLFMIVIQTSYLTPPMAPAIFYFRGIKPEEISTQEIFRGVVPFIFLQLLVLAIVMIFPQLVLWLPNKMSGFR